MFGSNLIAKLEFLTPKLHFRRPKTEMNTRDYIKMQSINFCYMSFMLQAVNKKTVSMNGTYRSNDG